MLLLLLLLLLLLKLKLWILLVGAEITTGSLQVQCTAPPVVSLAALLSPSAPAPALALEKTVERPVARPVER